MEWIEQHWTVEEAQNARVWMEEAVCMLCVQSDIMLNKATI